MNIKGMKKNKVYKMIIRLITGIFIVVYFTTAGIIGTHQVKAANNYTTEYKMATKTATLVTVEKEMNLVKGLEKIAKIYKCNDVSIIKEIYRVEKMFNLPKLEFMGQMNLENRFANTSRMDTNGKMSYGVCQLQIDTAREAYIKMKPMLDRMGIEMQPPTIDLIKNDTNYSIKFAGAYMKYFHTKYANPNQALASYNGGEGNTKYESTGYEYSYTYIVQQRKEEFRLIIGAFY